MPDPDSRTCPHCGRDLPAWKPDYCPACNLLVDDAADPTPPPCLLTTFGLGMCGLVSSAYAAGAVALCFFDDDPHPGRLLLWAIAASIFGAAAACWLGSRLTASTRRGFERFLVAAVIASFAGVAAAVVGLRNAYVVATLIATASLCLYAYLRHLPPEWGHHSDWRDLSGGP